MGKWTSAHGQLQSYEIWVITFLTCVCAIDERKDDESETGEKQQEEPVNPNLPIRQYLDKHIMPSLLEALEKMTHDKPEDPI